MMNKGAMPMSQVDIRLENDRLDIRCDEANVAETRSLTAEDRQGFAQWGETYRSLLDQTGSADTLLDLGRKMYAWLDGGARWLDRVRRDGRPPLVVDFVAPRHPSPSEATFLDAPWELLADEHGHLAAYPDLKYCPVRRLGPRATPAPPSDCRLSMVFMAAAPEGQVPLNYETEEAAILEATGNIGIDLTVEESGTLPLLAECLAQESLSEPVGVLHISCHGRHHASPRLLLEDDRGGPAPATAADLADALPAQHPRLLSLSACETAAPDLLLGSLSVALLSRGQPAVLGWAGSVADAAATRVAAVHYQK
jgi:hypothetical protein